MTMLPRALWLCCACSIIARAARLPLSDKALPYLGLDSGAPLRWDSASTLDAVQRARLVEVSPRGVRFVYDEPHSLAGMRALSNTNEPCAPERRSLCRMPEGLVLPSPGTGSNASIVIGGGATRSAILRAFAASDACALNGGGRNLSDGSVTQYTVSGCDVLQGRLILLYRPDRDQLQLLQQTLGPMAYAASILVSHAPHVFFADAPLKRWAAQGALACLYFSTVAASSTTDAAVVGLVLLAAMPFVRVPFITRADELHFAFSWALGALMAPLAIWRGDQGRAGEAAVFALSALADAIYRTPETPYAPLLCLFLAVRQWRKVIRHCQGAEPPTVTDAVDLLGTTYYLCFTADAGLLPQLTHPEDWPIYGGAGTYVAFAGAFYQHHLQHKKQPAT